MKMRNSGVLKYLKTRVTISFPNEEYKCRYCPLLETYSRNQCRRTGEYILDINGIGYSCPLEIIEEEEQHE